MSGPPAPTRDYVPFALATVGFAVLLGTAVMSGFLLANRAMVLDLGPSGRPDPAQPAANILLIGAMATLFVPALVTWNLLAPIGSAYRRGGLAMVSAFGAIVVSLVSIPLNEWLGPRGLVLMLVLALAGVAVLGRAVRRTRGMA